MDCNIRHIARAFDVTIKRRGERFRLEGVGATTAADVIKSLYSRADKGIDVNEIRRHLAESSPVAAEPITVSAAAARPAAVALNHPRTEGQRKLQSKIRRHAVTLCIGPAGSGKTHIAVTTALSLLASRSTAAVVGDRSSRRAASGSAICPATWSRKPILT